MHRHKPYTERELVAALRDWTERFGAPPDSCDWQSHARRRNPERRARYESTGRDWPSANTVYAMFDTWEKALRWAGVYQPKPKHKLRSTLPERCKHGHRLKRSGIYVLPNGSWKCKTCISVRHRDKVNRQRAEAAKQA